MPIFQAQSAEIFYEMDGDGPTALLIAGLASDVASWTPVRAALAGSFRLIMPDNRGAGRTKDNNGLAGLSIDAMADDIVQLAEHLQLEHCLLVGHSMGAAIAIEAALKRPALAEKLVLAGVGVQNARTTAAIGSLATLHARLGGGADWYRALFPWLFAPAFFQDQAVVETAVAAAVIYPFSPTTEMFSAQVAAIRGHSGAGAAPPHRTLVLVGADDILFTPNDSRALASQLPRAQFGEIEGAAHSLFWDQPAAAARTIIQFAAA